MPVNPFDFNSRDVVAFILVLMRVAGLFLTSPIFSSSNIPAQVKAAWTLLMAFLIFPIVDYSVTPLPEVGIPFALAVARELMVGFAIGLGISMLFAGIQMAGAIIDVQIGFGLVNVVDPVTSTQVSVIGQYYYFVAMMVFLAVDGDHLVIQGLSQTFDLIPLGQAHFSPALATKMNELFSQMFFIAFKVGAPVIGALFITNIALGIIARTVPQMNVFIVGMPLNVIVGLAVIAMSMSFFVFVLQDMFKGLYRDMAILIQTMR
jgi:flagellar biosynthetic protein FliR